MSLEGSNVKKQKVYLARRLNPRIYSQPDEIDHKQPCNSLFLSVRAYMDEYQALSSRKRPSWIGYQELLPLLRKISKAKDRAKAFNSLRPQLRQTISMAESNQETKSIVTNRNTVLEGHHSSAANPVKKLLEKNAVSISRKHIQSNDILKMKPNGGSKIDLKSSKPLKENRAIYLNQDSTNCRKEHLTVRHSRNSMNGHVCEDLSTSPLKLPKINVR